MIEEAVQMLLKLGETYPNLMVNGIILAGQSYSTSLIADLAISIRNLNSNQTFLRLTGIIIENPLFDPLYQRLSIDSLARELGIIDSDQHQQIEAL